MMRKWLGDLDPDDIKMVVSGALAVLLFAILVLTWSLDNYRRQDCERGCSTEMSAQRRN